MKLGQQHVIDTNRLFTLVPYEAQYKQFVLCFLEAVNVLKKLHKE